MTLLRAFWGRLPLIGRLLVTASLALLLAGAAMLFVSARQAAAEIRHDLEIELAKELDTLPAALAETVVIGDFATLQQTLDRYVARPLVVAAVFHDVTGARLQSDDARVAPSAPDWFMALVGFHDLSGSAPVKVGGHAYGDLSLTLTAQGLADRSWTHLKSHLAILLLAIALDFLGIWLVLRSGLAPLKQLESGADAMAGGNLDIQFTPRGSPELRHLIDAFDRMAKQVLAVQNDLQSTLNAIPDLLFELGLDGRYYNYKTSNVDLLPAPPGVFLGRLVAEILPPEAAAIILAALQEAHENGGSTGRQVERRCGQELKCFELSVARKAGVHADGPRFIVVSRDITERKRAEARLQLAASVFSHAREGIMITDAAGTIVEVNDTFTRITGYSREEALGQNPRILKSGRQPPGYYASMWQLLIDKGHWYGEAWNRRKNGEVYAEMITISAVRDAVGETQHYVSLFTDITPLKEHQQQLEHIAHYDALTRLPNRVLLADRLQQAIAQSQRHARPLAVIYLDLDGFKAVNDRHGHDAGDELLIAVAQRLKTALREGDMLARIGGDEFVAVLVDLERLQDCEPVLTRLLQAAAEPVMVGPEALRVSASIGVTLYPQDGADADLLLRHADQAMYQAKQAGKNRYLLFDVDQDEAVKTRHESLEHLRRALDRREFVLHYQPKVNMKTGAVIGAEALIRWQHPERGLLPPSAFLPVIEEHPLSVAVGEWVIETALAQIAAWRAAGLDIPVSVNVGARQLQQGDFVSRLAALLAAHPDVQPACLELEILETSALEDMALVSDVMYACRALGVRFALDDFGTGYSSLTYLKRLPAELLKIDQSFVRAMLDDPDDLAIVEGVVGLAKVFRRQAIAEGVETVAHGELLLPLGCELAQGYGIARPMPAAELPGWVAAWRPDPAWTAWRERPLSRDDRVIVFAEVEHRSWLRSLESFLAGDRGEPPPLDSHDCHFGRWHENEGRARYGDHPGFPVLGIVHDRVHALGRALVELRAQGRQADAQARLGELYALRDELIARLRGLVRDGERSGAKGTASPG